MLTYLWHFEGNTLVTLAVTLSALGVVFTRCWFELRERS